MNIKKTLTISAISLLSTVAYAQASQALSVNVSGVAGSGVTTWTFSGSSTTETNNSIRDSSGIDFENQDTAEFDSSSFISDGSIQDQIFTSIGGSATINIGSNTESITSIFLDSDTNEEDDLGIRLASPLAYSAGETISWTGSLVFSLDLNQFNLGSFDERTVNTIEITDSPILFNISNATTTAVPFEFSPTLGFVTVSILFGASRLRKRLKVIAK